MAPRWARAADALCPARMTAARPRRMQQPLCFSSSSSRPPPQQQREQREQRHQHQPVALLPPTIAAILDRAAPVVGPLPSSAPSPAVTVHGWVRSVRRLKNVSFLHITDGSTSVPIQAVLTKEQAAGLTTGTCVRITGEWKESPNKAGQARELVAASLHVLGPSDGETYPLQKKYHTPEYLRSLPHLRPRLPHNALLLQLRSLLTSSLTRFFASREFVQCYPPLITSSDCEGAGEVFSVSAANSADDTTPFFRAPKFLTVSTQLHLEALAAAVPRVWTLSPSFRAERSDTNRHLSEFYMLEAEVSFIDGLTPLLVLIQDMIHHLVSEVEVSRVGAELLQASGDAKEALEMRWRGLIQPGEWKRMTYTSAIELLQSAVREKKVDFKFAPRWGASLQSEHEKYLAAEFQGPVFVTDYPSSLKPFYMLPSASFEPTRPTVACFDLLLPSIGELIGGSLREHRLDSLVQSMKYHKLIPEDGADSTAGLGWYADLRRWGSQPHGGFGMGIERLLCYLSGVENIREASAFPRYAGRCDC